MLEKIKAILSENYDLNDARGIFISLFDENKKLLCSNGVLFTDKSLDEVISWLYPALIANQPTSRFVGIDIVLDIQQETNPQQIANINTKKYWIYVHSQGSDTSWVILPNTEKINDISSAVQAIKEKTKIGGQAEIYTFTTERKSATIVQ